MLLVAVLVVAVAGFAVYRLHGIFASQDVTSTPSAGANEIVPFNPKHVVLEVFGPPGTVATISYLDVNAQPQRADDVALPWAYDATTTQPAVFVNVQAQFGTDLTRRVTADINQPLPDLANGAAIRVNAMVNEGGVAGRPFAQNRRYGVAPSLTLGLKPFMFEPVGFQTLR